MALARTVDGLVSSDNFPVNGSLPAPWEVLGSANITTNRLKAPTASAGSRPGARWKITAEASTELFSQVTFRMTDSSGINGLQHAHYSTSARTGYGLHVDDPDTQITEWVSNSPSGLILDTSAARSANTPYVTQFYTAPSVQEGWAETNSTAISVSATDTTHNAVNKTPTFHRNNTNVSSQNIQCDDALWMRSKYLTVTLIGTATSGWKAQVYTSSDVLVAEATESSGVATVNLSRHGGVTLNVPSPTDDTDADTGGWAYVRVVSGAGIEVDRYADHTVYPGDEYEWSPDSGGGGGGGATSEPDPEPPTATSGESRIGPDDILFHQTWQHGGQFHGRYTRPGNAWHWTADLQHFERRVINQRRYEAVWTQDHQHDIERLRIGLLLEGTTSQEIASPTDFSTWGGGIPTSGTLAVSPVMAGTGWTTVAGTGAMAVSVTMAATGATTAAGTGAMLVEIVPQAEGLVGAIGSGAMTAAPVLAGTGTVS